MKEELCKSKKILTKISPPTKKNIFWVTCLSFQADVCYFQKPWNCIKLFLSNIRRICENKLSWSTFHTHYIYFICPLTTSYSGNKSITGRFCRVCFSESHDYEMDILNFSFFYNIVFILFYLSQLPRQYFSFSFSLFWCTKMTKTEISENYINILKNK